MLARLAQTSPRLGDMEYNFEQCRSLILAATGDGADLIVFPELALNGYLLQDMVSLTGLRANDSKIQELISLSGKISILIGLVEHGDDHFYYNSAFYLEGGRLVACHRKGHLPTYGMFDEGRYFSSGSRFRAFDTRFARTGVMICEDAWHPINPYILSQDGAELLVIISNSPVRGMRESGKFRSIENWQLINRSYAMLYSNFVLYVNRVGCEDGISFGGCSHALDPYGETIAELPFLDEATASVEIDLEELSRARVGSPILRDEKFLTSLNELKRIKKESFGD
ncbi:nitrilase-related carbon-nitrogen hydrolase [Gemmatimonadota bacterium]